MPEEPLLILEKLKQQYPNARIALNYSNNWELLVAVILSAQCTDKRVNIVTETLFPKYRNADIPSLPNNPNYPNPSPEIKQIINFAEVPIEELETDIKSTGFYHNKAKNIQAAAKMVLEKFNGNVPRTMEDILTLPGVARKTANIVLGNAYGVVEGIAVDTHVRRLSQRLGFTKHNDPEKIEKDLMKLFPKDEWLTLTYYLIEHGRAICDAKKPKCDQCILNQLCPSAYTFRHVAHLNHPRSNFKHQTSTT